MNLTTVGTSRCDVPAREAAGGIVAPLNAARTAQRAVPTRFRGSMREVVTGNFSLFSEQSLASSLSRAGAQRRSVLRPAGNNSRGTTKRNDNQIHVLSPKQHCGCQ